MFELVIAVLEALVFIVGGASMLAAVLPVPKKATKILVWLRKALDCAAINVAHARNAEVPEEKQK